MMMLYSTEHSWMILLMTSQRDAGHYKNHKTNKLPLLEIMFGKDSHHGIKQTHRNMELSMLVMVLKMITSVLWYEVN